MRIFAFRGPRAVGLFLIAALATRGRGTGRTLLLAYPLVWAVLWNLSGLHIETKSTENDVLIDFR